MMPQKDFRPAAPAGTGTSSAVSPLVRCGGESVIDLVTASIPLSSGRIDIDGVSVLFPIPVEGAGIIAARFANAIAAAGPVSPLSLSGGISTRDLVLTRMA